MLQIQELDQEQFAALWRGGEIISRHAKFGPKVFRTQAGDYVKVFNPKPGLTKRHFFPKYRAFIANVKRLHKLGITTIEVKQIYFLKEHQSFAVAYTPIAGKDLRSLVQENQQEIVEFIPFLVKLHDLGVYFRGLHLGNVLRLPNGDHGLIDIADLYFKWGALSIWDRVRNLAHIVKTKPDDLFFQRYGINVFMNEYLTAAGIEGHQRRWFARLAKFYGLGKIHE